MTAGARWQVETGKDFLIYNYNNWWLPRLITFRPFSLPSLPPQSRWLI